MSLLIYSRCQPGAQRAAGGLLHKTYKHQIKSSTPPTDFSPVTSSFTPVSLVGGGSEEGDNEPERNNSRGDFVVEELAGKKARGIGQSRRAEATVLLSVNLHHNGLDVERGGPDEELCQSFTIRSRAAEGEKIS